jgi:hypothetical protein
MKITSLVCPHKRRARVDLDGEPDREPLKNKAGSLRAAGRVSCLGTNPKGDRMRTVTSSVLYAKRRPGRCAMSGGLQMGSYRQRFRARVRCCCSTSPMKPKSKGNAGPTETNSRSAPAGRRALSTFGRGPQRRRLDLDHKMLRLEYGWRAARPQDGWRRGAKKPSTSRAIGVHRVSVAVGPFKCS